MAEALRLFIKELSKSYPELNSPRILATYDPAVPSGNRSTAKSAASRKLREPAAEIAREMLAMFNESAGYATLDELVRDRTETGTAIADAVEAESARAIDRLSSQEHESSRRQGATGVPACRNHVWEAIGLSRATQPAFRDAFDAALRADGLARDTTGFWRSIDTITDECASSNGELDPYLITVCQHHAIEAFLLTSLEGARYQRISPGIAPDETPVNRDWHSSPPLRESAAVRALPRAQLQAIVLTGPNAQSFYAETGEPLPNGTMAAKTYLICPDRPLRIGRDDLAWCEEGNRTPVLLSVINVSRHHCEIAYREGDWIITDIGYEGMGSTRGTLIYRANRNHEDVFLREGEAILQHGDLICLAPHHATGGLDASCFTWRKGEQGVNFRFEIIS